MRLTKPRCASFTPGSASGRHHASTLTASPPMRLILFTDQSSISLETRPPGVSRNTESSSVTISPLAGDSAPSPCGTA